MQRPASYRWQKVVLGAGVVHAMRGGQHPWTDRSSSSSPAKAGDSEKIMLTNASSLVAAEPSKTIADNGASRHGANSGQHALHHAECNKPANFGRKRTSERRQCESQQGGEDYASAPKCVRQGAVHQAIRTQICGSCSTTCTARSTNASRPRRGAAFLERPRHPGARPVRCRRHAHSGRVLNQRSEGGRQNAVPRFGLVSGGELFHRNFPRVLRAVMGSEPWSLPPVAALGSASVRTNLVAKYCCSFTPTALCCPEPWGEFARRSRLIRKSLAGILGSFSMATRPSVDGLQASTLGYGLSASITVIREFLSVVRSAKLSADSALYR